MGGGGSSISAQRGGSRAQRGRLVPPPAPPLARVPGGPPPPPPAPPPQPLAHLLVAQGVGAELREEGAPERVVPQQAEHTAQDRAHVVGDRLGAPPRPPASVLPAGG